MRLIDADALKKAMDGYWGRCQRIRKPRNGETAVFLDVMATVEKQPTVDAVPVIRCKDCARGATCFTYRETGDGGGFCKWAERRPQTP